MPLTLGSGLLVIGLDGEMSSADLPTGGRLIQAGLAVLDDDRIDLTSQTISWDEMSWDPRAAQVHGLSRAEVDAAPRADVVDESLAAWLGARGGRPGRRQVVSVGFNVNGFDHPFFRDALPQTMAMISRRAIDLNGVCKTLDGWDPNPRNNPRDWAGWKRSSQKAALARLTDLNVPGRQHDAGFDAAIAVLAWVWLREQIRSAHAPVRD